MLHCGKCRACPRRSESLGIALHSHDATWAALHAGEKTWFVAPPGQPPVEPYKHHAAADLAGLWRCTQRPSELVYLPDGHWHATANNGAWSLAVGGQGSAAPGVYEALLGNVSRGT